MFKPKILYVQNNLEYYLDLDNKLVSRRIDDTIDYRKAELHPDVIALLNTAREYNRTPSRNNIDAIITYQATSINKAKNYIKYRLLGTANYLDVFGDTADAKYNLEKHMQQGDKIEQQLDSMQRQLWDMQKLIMNMAKQENKTNKSNKKIG